MSDYRALVVSDIFNVKTDDCLHEVFTHVMSCVSSHFLSSYSTDEDVYHINDLMRQCLEDIYVKNERAVLAQITKRQKTLKKGTGAKS